MPPKKKIFFNSVSKANTSPAIVLFAIEKSLLNSMIGLASRGLKPWKSFFHHYTWQALSELQAINQSFMTCFSKGLAKIDLLEKRVLYHL